MARVGNKHALTKLKSAIKRLPSFTKFGRTASEKDSSAAAEEAMMVAVYVGKSRRRYDVAVEVAEHPLFRELVDSTGREEDDGGVYVADCEVVMFEHLLWMIHNAVGSTDHLVHFYTTTTATC